MTRKRPPYPIALAVPLALLVACKETEPTTRLGRLSDENFSQWRSQCKGEVKEVTGVGHEVRPLELSERFAEREIGSMECTNEDGGEVALVWDVKSKYVVRLTFQGHAADGRSFADRVEPLFSPFVPADEWRRFREGLAESWVEHDDKGIESRDKSFRAFMTWGQHDPDEIAEGRDPRPVYLISVSSN
jgi:hypothetical protein